MAIVLDGTTGISASGNITVDGTLSAGTLSLSSFSAVGNITGGNLVTTGIVSATGNVTGDYFIGNGSQLTGIDATSIQNGTSNVKTFLDGNVAVSVAGTSNVAVFDATGLLITGTSSATGNVTGNYFIGNGSQLTGIDATSIQNGTSNVKTYLDGNVAVSVAGTANVAVYDATGTSVTGNVGVSGNVTGANFDTAGVVTATGNVTGGNLVTAGQITATGNVTSGNVNTTKVTATEVIGGGISLVGNTISSSDSTLTIDPATAGAPGLVVIAGNLSVQGTTTTYESTTVTINDLVFTVANNASTSAAADGGGIEVGPVGSPYATWLYDEPNSVWSTALGISATGNITAGNLSGTSIVGTLTTAAQTNITSVGTLDSLSATGNITGGNIITGGALDVTGNVTAGNLSGTSIVGTLTTAAQTNITSVGTLGSLSVTGNVTGGNLITAGLVSLSSITKTGSNGVGNIGATTSTFDTVFAKATSAQYADVAEYYIADRQYPVGTVLVFGGDQEVVESLISHSAAIAGVVSSNPAVIMNSGLDHDNRVLVALLGRVPCRAEGPVSRGDLLVAGPTPGTAVRLDPAQYQPGCVIGKALQDCESGELKNIEVVVGRL